MSREESDKKFGRRYLESFKQAVVKEVEVEGNLVMICARHEISRRGLQKWMDQYGSVSYQLGKRKRRSLSEREGIAREIVSGHLSIKEAMLKYNASDVGTVNVWVRDYKKRQQDLLGLLPGSIDLSDGKPVGDGMASSSALKLAELKIRALEVMLDIASKEFKVDIRKKFGAKR
jgi:transposase-like protein